MTSVTAMTKQQSIDKFRDSIVFGGTTNNFWQSSRGALAGFKTRNGSDTSVHIVLGLDSTNSSVNSAAYRERIDEL
jgi:hypothetical protein